MKSAPTTAPFPQELQNLLLACLACGLYYLTFRLNEHLGERFLYSQGIALVFLPAGIKHVSLLLARGWGALGCFAALMWLSFEFWPGITLVQAAAYSGISTLASWAGIAAGMRLLRIERDLANLQFIHLPLLDLLSTAVHGLVVNVYFMAADMKHEHLLANALAMMFGDYVGSFLVLTCLWAGLATIRLIRRSA